MAVHYTELRGKHRTWFQILADSYICRQYSIRFFSLTYKSKETMFPQAKCWVGKATFLACEVYSHAVKEHIPKNSSIIVKSVEGGRSQVYNKIGSK